LAGGDGTRTMSERILTLEDREEWGEWIRRLPIPMQDVYYLPEYYGLFETAIAKAECFLYWEGDDVLVYPYLKTDISKATSFEPDEHYYDIEGAYGYNGFISNSASGAFLSTFAEVFSSYCLANRIVAEFTRFNPLLSNHLIARHLDRKTVNQNIIIDLDRTEEELWAHSYEHAARKNINKAKRSGLRVEIFRGSEIGQEWIDIFYRIYIATMDRNTAEASYYWDATFFANISKCLDCNSIFLFTLTAEGNPVSVEVILLSKHHAYSYLGGTLSQYYPERPNNILKHEAILTLKKMGVEKFCLGGGTTPGDGIFKYKQTFAKTGAVDFVIGKKIHDRPAYERLCRQWETMFPEKIEKYSHYLLKYRQ